MVAVERLVGAYNAWATNGASEVPEWLKDMRSGAIARFQTLGFPNMKQEAWRFTSVAPIAEGSFELAQPPARTPKLDRSEEHTSELQSRSDLVCRLLLEKKKKKKRLLKCN